jgi:hypothetical protein
MKLTNEFWAEYIPLISQSINVAVYSLDPIYLKCPKAFVSHQEWGGRNWESRASRWAQTKGVRWYNTRLNYVQDECTRVNPHICIPLFPSLLSRCPHFKGFEEVTRTTYVNGVIKETHTTKNNTKEDSRMKNTVNNLMDKNKDAVAIAAKLSTGKTANSFFLNKLVGKFPWYAKVFSKKKDLATNPVAKMVAAQTAMALVTHFASDNKKLNYVAEGMVQEALVDVTVNSKVLESMIKELENLVTIPEFSKDA